ncbi:PREDICTED: uncharacterized protein LOC105462773 [Wasmannia auropunctata]|uniref:uncharacterized protein LOC105462773 n=1 Tax=Wasmannia auropunctata TaxID=64793 RepID=UPI0005EFFCF5|nr:PREDICTED: uncharacterized protein LOC105462773 [Wasmannia auropunctata]
MAAYSNIESTICMGELMETAEKLNVLINKCFLKAMPLKMGCPAEGNNFQQFLPQDLNESILDVNNDICSILQWAKNNGLLFNASKTQAIIFGSARYINSIEFERLPNIVVNKDKIQFSSSIKYLGVHIENTLSWDKQVTQTAGKISSKLYQLKLCKHLLTDSLRIQLITTLILLHLNYCCAALTDITAEQNLRLQRALNSCVRLIFGIKRDVHITSFYCKLGWLKTDRRRDHTMASLLHDIILNQKPKIIFEGLTFRSVELCRNTRADVNLLSLPQCRTETYKKSFRYHASKIWNNLPPELRKLQSIKVFRTRLFEYLLNN